MLFVYPNVVFPKARPIRAPGVAFVPAPSIVRAGYVRRGPTGCDMLVPRTSQPFGFGFTLGMNTA
jgi:hypothetical protein